MPPITVTFTVSGESHAWTGAQPTLLSFAEHHGIFIPSGCTYGDCGTCMTPLVSGTIEYLHETGAQPDPGTCLPCSCRPATSIALEA